MDFIQKKRLIQKYHRLVLKNLGKGYYVDLNWNCSASLLEENVFVFLNSVMNLKVIVMKYHLLNDLVNVNLFWKNLD